MKIKRILYPTDLTECGLMALDHVVFLAKKYKADVTILYVDEATYLLNPMNPYAETDLTILSDQVQRVADQRIRELIARSFPKDVSVKVNFRIGRPYYEIVEAATASKSDLIVMGTHGHSGLNIIMGSNAERIARLAPCPVMTIGRKKHFDGIHRVVYPVDFSSLSKNLLCETIDFVRTMGSELRLLHVVTDSAMNDGYVQEQFRNFLDRVDTSGMIFKTDVRRAATARQGILEYSVHQEADLILIGSHGFTGLRKMMMGSVATDVLNTSSIPVLVLRAFKSKPAAAPTARSMKGVRC